ncbi:MAG: DUF2867 domain-containing protein [Pikeienuella sp.]
MTPPEADLVAPRGALDFLDTRGMDLPRPMTALEAWDLMMREPLPGLRLAFRIRDAISSLFGVKRIGGFTGARAAAPEVGDKLDFFLVERIAPEILTLSARDRHLETICCVTTHDRRLAITSSVKTLNGFGRAYMIPVGPAHRLIVGAMLKRARRTLITEGAGR